jgi:chaperone-like protein
LPHRSQWCSIQVEGDVMFGAVLGKAAGFVASGLVGAAAYDGVKRVLRAGVVRETAVTVTTWGLRGVRAAETGAERTRLVAADVVSEARQRIGEQTPPPGGGGVAGHGHEH